MKHVCWIYRKATNTKVNQLIHNSYIRLGTQCFGWHIYSPFIALVFLLLAEYIRNACSKSQLLGIHISFQMCEAMNSIVVKMVMMLILVARSRVIMMISSEADNDIRLTCVLLR